MPLCVRRNGRSPKPGCGPYKRGSPGTSWRDGCYVLETDVPQTVLEAQAVHDRYRDLHEVEQDFRTMKTGLLEVRPVFVRKAPRTRAHVLVTMLALKDR